MKYTDVLIKLRKCSQLKFVIELIVNVENFDESVKFEHERIDMQYSQVP